jgi:hypothetical protein
MVDAVLPLLCRVVTDGLGGATLLGSQCPSPHEAALLLSWSGKPEHAECTAHLPGLPCLLAAPRLTRLLAQVLSGFQALHLQE